jgi:NitT/TauT family transport system permease protein
MKACSVEDEGSDTAGSMTVLEDARASLPETRRLSLAAFGWPVAVAFVWLAAGAVTLALPDIIENAYTPAFGAALTGLGIASAAASVWANAWHRQAAPWLAVLGVFFGLWELLSAKAGWLPQPFFPPPQALVEVYVDDWARLVESTYYSVRLLTVGYLLGAAVGFVIGIAIGWSKIASYWIHPVLRFIGPLPAVAWLPLAFFAFPSSWSASVFLIALATGFPVAILTWSGVAAVPNAYYDVARTLGGDNRFLVLKVAIPAALPSVFVGLFMGMGASFAVLIVAEMLGVKAGLGWYLQWAQGWAAYANMYAALIVMSLMCSGLVGLLFRVRDRVLGWQKGLVRW